MGPFKLGILYIVSGVGGIVFSCCCNSSISVGASTAIFGLLGGLLGMVIVNWKALDRSPEMRCCLIVMIVVIVLFGFVFSLSDGLAPGTS